jgi:hypothetical protein
VKDFLKTCERLVKDFLKTCERLFLEVPKYFEFINFFLFSVKLDTATAVVMELPSVEENHLGISTSETA